MNRTHETTFTKSEIFATLLSNQSFYNQPHHPPNEEKSCPEKSMEDKIMALLPDPKRPKRSFHATEIMGIS
jgi:hypothetical protein